jgi:hypothetical protein
MAKNIGHGGQAISTGYKSSNQNGPLGRIVANPKGRSKGHGLSMPTAANMETHHANARVRLETLSWKWLGNSHTATAIQQL